MASTSIWCSCNYIKLFNSVANVPDIFITIRTILLSIIYAIYKMNENEDDIDFENIIDEII